MRRVHLLELEDLPWVPSAVRDGGTDLLDLAFDRMGFYDGATSKLLALIETTGASRVIDLCSGGGGGALSMRRRLRAAGCEVEITLTDRYPNADGAARVRALNDPRTRYLAEPADAMRAAGDAPGVRTMYSAMHHFRPDDVTALVAAVVARREPLAFFDVAASPALRRVPLALAPPAMAMNMLALFVGCLVITPLARPLRASRFALTYALPLIPALVAWDGTVSALRAYTADEALALARAAPGADGYDWDAGVAGPALYLLGAPR
ncbi:MAG: hypothetical protein R3A48_27055 [Polyangiales bacterium]